MGFDKDIRFPEKKVDSGWKEQISRDKSVPATPVPQPGQTQVAASPEFMNFLKSLATQALMSLGEIPHPMTGQRELDPATAKEMIDLLTVLKLKTQGNCSPEENAIFTSLLPELQLKFSQQA
jgi:hypothetical protein